MYQIESDRQDLTVVEVKLPHTFHVQQARRPAFAPSHTCRWIDESIGASWSHCIACVMPTFGAVSESKKSPVLCAQATVRTQSLTRSYMHTVQARKWCIYMCLQ